MTTELIKEIHATYAGLVNQMVAMQEDWRVWWRPVAYCHPDLVQKLPLLDEKYLLSGRDIIEVIPDSTIPESTDSDGVTTTELWIRFIEVLPLGTA